MRGGGAIAAGRPNLPAAIVAGGLASGALDLLYAVGSWHLRGVDTGTVLRSIASGLIGKSAHAGGPDMLWLGAGLHFVLTLAMAGAFSLLWAAGRPWRTSSWVAGPLYGALIYVFMNRVVLPLSAFPGPQPTPLNAADLAAHMLLVGMPIALAARRWAGGPRRTVLFQS